MSALPDIQGRLAAAPPVANTRLAILLAWLMDRLDDAVDHVGVENIIKELHDLYDTYIAPIDVPYVPDPLEPTLIDNPLKKAISDLVLSVHKRIHKD